MKLHRNTIGGIRILGTDINPEKETILWLHGYTLSSELWLSCWQYSKEFNNLAIDIPGHGASSPIRQFSSLIELTDAVFNSLKKFQVDYIIGSSFGGILGIQLLVQYADRFKGLVLVSSPYGGSEIDSEAQLKNQELIKLYKERGCGPWLTELWMQSPPPIFKGVMMQEEIALEFKKIIDSHSWDELKDNGFALFTSHKQVSKKLKGLTNPVFLFVGENDMDYIKRCNQILYKTFRNVERTYLSGCYHLPLFEQPATTIPAILAKLSTVRSVS